MENALMQQPSHMCPFKLFHIYNGPSTYFDPDVAHVTVWYRYCLPCNFCIVQNCGQNLLPHCALHLINTQRPRFSVQFLHVSAIIFQC